MDKKEVNELVVNRLKK